MIFAKSTLTTWERSQLRELKIMTGILSELGGCGILILEVIPINDSSSIFLPIFSTASHSGIASS